MLYSKIKVKRSIIKFKILKNIKFHGHIDISHFDVYLTFHIYAIAEFYKILGKLTRGNFKIYINIP